MPPAAAKAALYAVPTVPAESEVVETLGDCDAAAITMLSDFAPVRLFASFTCTVNAAEPAAVGVPEIAPALDSVRPAGSAPLVTLHVYGVLPPVAPKVVLYALPTVPPAKEFVETVGACAAAATVNVSAFVAVALAASFA